MTLSLEKRTHKPPRILIYGPHGLGKTTFASMAPNPVFIQTEDGIDAIDCDAFPLAKKFDDVLTYLEELATQDHNYKTLAIDSIDWLETLIWDKVLSSRPNDEKGRKVVSIEDYGFGKGYVHAMDFWHQYIDCLDYLRNNKDMMIIQISHASIKRFDNPETDAYDRYDLKLSKTASAKLQEHSDIVLFANYFVGVKKDDVGFGAERKRAIGSGERVLYTEERPSFIAKNRFSLPPEIPFTKDGSYWSTIASHIPYFTKGE